MESDFSQPSEGVWLQVGVTLGEPYTLRMAAQRPGVQVMSLDYVATASDQIGHGRATRGGGSALCC